MIWLTLSAILIGAAGWRLHETVPLNQASIAEIFLLVLWASVPLVHFRWGKLLKAVEEPLGDEGLFSKGHRHIFMRIDYVRMARVVRRVEIALFAVASVGTLLWGFAS